MKEISRILAIFLLVVITGIMVFWRVSQETYGRDISNIVALHDPDSVTRLPKLTGLERTGHVSIFSGREMIDFFHVQVPLNPYIFTQFQQMDIQADSQYIVTSRRDLYKHLIEVIPRGHPYQDRRNIVYQGVELPYAHVIETPLPIQEIKNLPAPSLPDELAAMETPRLWIRTVPEWRALLTSDSLPVGLELILSPEIPVKQMPENMFRTVNEIFVIGKNAVRVSADDSVVTDQFMILNDRKLSMVDGRIRPLPQYIYTTLLFLSVLFFGFWCGPDYRVLVWIGGFFAFYFLPDVGISFLLGWIFSCGLMAIPSRNQPAGAIISVLLLYGFFYQGHIIQPYQVDVFSFTGGLFLSLSIWVFPMKDWLSKPLKRFDMVLLLVLGTLYFWLDSHIHAPGGIMGEPVFSEHSIGLITLFAIIFSYLFWPASEREGQLVPRWFPLFYFWGLLMATPISPVWLLCLLFFGSLIVFDFPMKMKQLVE